MTYDPKAELWVRNQRITERARIAKMHFPVRCRCGQIYDLGTVYVTARYADCSVWTAPCCGRQADDRKWKGVVDYEELY